METSTARIGSTAKTARPFACYALVVISGRHAGTEHPLPPEGGIMIGRGKDVDLVVDDDMTSRHHARIYLTPAGVMIEDLNSSNGTFVNGQQVKQASLDEGDRVRIGRCNFHLTAKFAVSAEAQNWWHETKRKIETERIPLSARTAPRTVSGSLSLISLVDLLQLLSHARTTGTLTIKTGRNVGVVVLQDGTIVHARINERTARLPEKTLYRLLRWKHGHFELDQKVEGTFSEPMQEATETLLMEGVRQADEIAELESALPADLMRVVPAQPLPGPLHELIRPELEVFQLVYDHQSFPAVLDQFMGTDLEAYQHVINLLNRKFINLAKGPAND